MPCSRRSLLQRAGTVAGLAATVGAGCLSVGRESGYRLVPHDVDGTLADEFLVAEPVETRAETRVDYDTETKRDWLAELFETGSVTAVQWPLVHPDDWGTETRPRPTFLQHDGAYHEVTTETTRDVERERWLFAVQRTDEEPPSDATVASEPFDLSWRDRDVLEAALDAVYADNDGFLGEPDIDGLRPVQYHCDMDAEASDLVPEPPFDYVDYSGSTYRVVVEQRTVTVPERTFAVEQVAPSRDALDSYAEETVPDARLDRDALSDAARDVLDSAVDSEPGSRYHEEPPLSDGLSTVLDELGVADDLRSLDSYDEPAAFRNAVASYDGDWYLFDLLVKP
ncbi:hypothetical protein [Haloarchaeobius iranensis]|uniref:Uncharacterized protein n=1 Tax=Haloarchaeobius iranensis TaxID=996166 RepID=A0A1G9ZIH6_9EURY|nr:hypothetical protein [Haloarchaeobius iranensis]SDN20831.1 hypothetical protein SAMN05192554_12055 [Haloarchaeobius iranensis]